MSRLSGGIVPTFQEVYENLQTLDNDKLDKSSIAENDVSPSTKSHDKNDYIIYNGSLYKVLENIAIGETLRIGTNIKKTTICDEIILLNNLVKELTKYKVALNPSTNRLGLFYEDDE